MEKVQRLTYQQIKDGYVTFEECQILQDHAKGKMCLEIGSWFGRSTIAMAETAEKVYAVDTFKGLPPALEQGDRFTSLDGFFKNIVGYENIHIIINRSEIAVPKIKETFDLVFIDGLHTYEAVRTDAVNSLKLLRSGGLMFFHDYYPLESYPGVKRAVDELFTGIEGSFGMMAWVSKEMAK